MSVHERTTTLTLTRTRNKVADAQLFEWITRVRTIQYICLIASNFTACSHGSEERRTKQQQLIGRHNSMLSTTASTARLMRSKQELAKHKTRRKNHKQRVPCLGPLPLIWNRSRSDLMNMNCICIADDKWRIGILLALIIIIIFM